MQGLTRLVQFFQEAYIESALDAYVVAYPNWNVSAKIDLYQRADVAFSRDLPDMVRLQTFRTIYQELKSYWQIFRSKNAIPYWDSDTTFAALNALTLASRHSGVTLHCLDKDMHGKGILDDLIALRGLKQNDSYPYMAVSKFLHFANPKLFPIFDDKVVWNTVCEGAFKHDYRDFCKRHQFKSNESSERFNLNYTLWASELIRDADPKLMTIFAQWAMRQVPHITQEKAFLENFPTYYATAFEFVAVGGAHLVRTS